MSEIHRWCVAAANAIERKDATIAVLVGALKESRSIIIESCGAFRIPWPEASMGRINSAIAQHDIPKDGL